MIKKFLLVFLAFILAPHFVYSAKKKAEKPPAAVKKEEKLSLLERIKLVLKYGNTSQVLDSLKKIPTLKEEDQKSLLKELGDLIKTSEDPEIQKGMIDLVGNLKWNDLDKELIPFLKSKNPEIVTSSANAIRKKKVRDAVATLKELIKGADFYNKSPSLNDILNTYSYFKDTSLEDFLFDKLKDEKVLEAYKAFILKYFGALDSTSKDIKQYLLDIVSNKDKDLNLRINSVRAIGSMGYVEARDELRKQLEEIEAMTDKEEKKKNFFLRLEIITALVKMKDDKVKPLLIEMTRDDDETVRARAIRKLSEFNGKEFVDLLEYKAKYDASPAVQKEAKKALNKIHGKSDDSEPENEANP